MRRNLFEMSDAALEREREKYDARLYKQYYGDDTEPTCSECTRYCGGQCERFDEATEEYDYVDVNPDCEACEWFEQREHDPYEDEPPDNFDWYEYQCEKRRIDD